jgi:predicted methyltransferase
MNFRHLVMAALLATTLAAFGCRSPKSPSLAPAEGKLTPSPAALEIVAAPDRADDDKRLDAGRRPAELLTFIGVKPGMRVAELGAGTGYTAELLARAVGPSGQVYGQNSAWILERYAEKPWSARLNKPVMKNVVRLDRPFDDPFPSDVHDLDLVLCVLFYHDTVWMGVDRPKMLRAVWNALRPGGGFVVVDHSGRIGTGVSEVKTLHRIEERVVKNELEAAGFRLRAEGAFLRNPDDSRDWNDAPSANPERRGTSDRFALVYEKP